MRENQAEREVSKGERRCIRPNGGKRHCCCCRGPQGEQGPQGEPGPKGESGVIAVASFFAFERQFESGKPIPLITGTADETGQIQLENETKIRLEPGRYCVWYSVSALLEQAGYLQITPSHQGSPLLVYGVYAKTADALVSAGGTNFLLVSASEPSVFRLNYNSNVNDRSGAASVMVWKLADPN